MPDAVLLGDDRVNGVTFERYEVDFHCHCPGDDCCGEVSYRGDVLVDPNEMQAHIVGAPCDLCGQRFYVEFHLTAADDTETFH